MAKVRCSPAEQHAENIADTTSVSKLRAFGPAGCARGVKDAGITVRVDVEHG